MADTCIICNETGVKLTECRDIESWTTLRKAAVAHDHQRLLEIRVDESGFPRQVVKYRRLCRAIFTLKKNAKKQNHQKTILMLLLPENEREVMQDKGFHQVLKVATEYFARRPSISQIRDQGRNSAHPQN